eukprot:15366214-Ditylum_brightwellii.AAC.1
MRDCEHVARQDGVLPVSCCGHCISVMIGILYQDVEEQVLRAPYGEWCGILSLLYTDQLCTRTKAMVTYYTITCQ